MEISSTYIFSENMTFAFALVFITGICWGAYRIVLKPIGKRLNPFISSYIIESFSVVLLFFCLYFLTPIFPPIYYAPTGLVYALIAGILIGVYEVSSIIAYEKDALVSTFSAFVSTCAALIPAVIIIGLHGALVTIETATGIALSIGAILLLPFISGRLCPKCKERLVYDATKREHTCPKCGTAYRIKREHKILMCLAGISGGSSNYLFARVSVEIQAVFGSMILLMGAALLPLPALLIFSRKNEEGRKRGEKGDRDKEKQTRTKIRIDGMAYAMLAAILVAIGTLTQMLTFAWFPFSGHVSLTAILTLATLFSTIYGLGKIGRLGFGEWNRLKRKERAAVVFALVSSIIGVALLQNHLLT